VPARARHTSTVLQAPAARAWTASRTDVVIIPSPAWEYQRTPRAQGACRKCSTSTMSSPLRATAPSKGGVG